MKENKMNQHKCDLSILKELELRGLLAQVSYEKLDEIIENENPVIYVGVDPTGPSLHTGHLLSILTLKRYKDRGLKTIVLIGDATGMIGDPSGRISERSLLTKETVDNNVKSLQTQIRAIINPNSENKTKIVRNNDWIGSITFVDWLRDVGKHFKLSNMLAKESVKKRLNSENGITFTEFSYQTMQAYDFYYLNKKYGVNVQIGGNDQWGNILAGIALTHKISNQQVYGCTSPLITTKDGEKIGKSMGNAIWLDKSMTTPYEFYQYWINVEDTDVEDFLKYFTFSTLENIEQVMLIHKQAPEKRYAQKELAKSMTELIHGVDELNKVLRASKALFGGDISEFTDDELLRIFDQIPIYTISRREIEQQSDIAFSFTKSGIFSSNGEFRRLVKNGGFYINNVKANTGNYNELFNKSIIDKKVVVVRKGKKNYIMLKLS